MNIFTFRVGFYGLGFIEFNHSYKRHYYPEVLITIQNKELYLPLPSCNYPDKLVEDRMYYLFNSLKTILGIYYKPLNYSRDPDILNTLKDTVTRIMGT